jgi:preprotein translocase subunit YajC
MMFSLLMLAEENGGTSSGGSWYLLVMIGLFAAIFYFLIWRPQQKRMRSQMELIESVRTGDEVVTQGGIYGFVTELEDDTLLVEVSEGVEIRIAKSAVLNNLSAAERAAEKKKEEKEKEEGDEEAGDEEADRQPGDAKESREQEAPREKGSGD